MLSLINETSKDQYHLYIYGRSTNTTTLADGTKLLWSSDDRALLAIRFGGNFVITSYDIHYYNNFRQLNHFHLVGSPDNNLFYETSSNEGRK